MSEKNIEIDGWCIEGEQFTNYTVKDSKQCGLLNKHPCMIMYHPLENQPHSRLCCNNMKEIEFVEGIVTCVFHESEEDIKQRELIMSQRG